MKPSIALTVGFILFLPFAKAADLPVARVLIQPGADYEDTKRVWQGIPGIERADNGRLWATWYTGDVGEGAMGNYAMVATSPDVGKPWSKPLVIQGPAGTRIGDPLPWMDPLGRLWIFYTQFTEKTETTPMLRATFAIRADDPQVAMPAWSDPFLVATDGILFGKPIVRKDGAWIAPFFINGNPAWKAQVADRETGCLISTDQGSSWSWLGGTSIPDEQRNFSEATIAERNDGSIWMVIRTTLGLWESVSHDGGKSWSEAAGMAGFARGPATRACIRRLNSGAFLLVYHDAPPTKTGSFGRSRLTAWLSVDEGRTWPHKVLLDERSGVSYPDAIQATDGRILITYDLGRYRAGDKAILYCTLGEEDIRAGDFVTAEAHPRLLINRCYGYGNHAEIRDESLIAESLPQKERFHLYLLIGQSNMAGRGHMENAESISRLRILKFSPRNVWAPGTDPLHTDKPAIAGVGLGISFARVMADADPEITVGLIPCAVGGTPLERWQKGADLYEAALARAKVAMADGTLKGILWHQGESDAGNEANAKNYGARLVGMIAALREDLGAGEVPFVAGSLGEFLEPVTKEGTASYWTEVNGQLAGLAAVVPAYGWASSSGLIHQGDKVHFDSPSLREFGRRYAKVMVDLQGRYARVIH
jgi:Carbohydrate esterase, sialic acid-specific acetylesterase/BNR repeat-like domain